MTSAVLIFVALACAVATVVLLKVVGSPPPAAPERPPGPATPLPRCLLCGSPLLPGRSARSDLERPSHDAATPPVTKEVCHARPRGA